MTRRAAALRIGAFGLLASQSVALSSAAQDCTAPCAGYEFSIELQNDLTFAADASSENSNILEPSLSVSGFLLPTRGLGLAGTLTTEPVEDPAFGQWANLDGIGAYVEDLYMLGEAGAVAFRFGKFDPVFSLAAEVLPGVNSTELVDDIDASERLGAEADFVFEGLGLDHRLSVAAFTTDRTLLGGSFFADRETFDLTDGGAGNTGGLSSFSVVLTSCDGAETWDCAVEGAFGYRTAFRHQKSDRSPEGDGAAAPDERAYLVGATRNLELRGRDLDLLGEIAFLQNYEGGHADALFLTAAARLELGPVAYVATYSQRSDPVSDGIDADDRLADLEVLYAPDRLELPLRLSDWEVAAAYTYALSAEEGARHILAVRLTLEYASAMSFSSEP